MNNTFVVKMSSDDSSYVEKKFYLLSSGRSNLAFLAKEDGVNMDIFSEYADLVDQRCLELELAKSKMSKKYEPKELSGLAYDYMFDFENESLVYTAK